MDRPTCKFFAEGRCKRKNKCPFLHVNVVSPISSKAGVHAEPNSNSTVTHERPAYSPVGTTVPKAIKLDSQAKEQARVRANKLWKQVVDKSRELADPWAEFHLETVPAEFVKRHRYLPNYLSSGAEAHGKKWETDEVLVKVAKDSFISGAMRQCYRMKKLPQIPNKHAFHGICWKGAHNYVGKQYKNFTVERRQYFDDVMMQAEAHHWAVLFNAKKPPKPVEMIAAVVVEFVERPGSPLYCAERFIDGQYLKHNSNVGFVEPLYHRLTPQAFSHSSFVDSTGRLMVIDVQGVNDLYTDPQIHSATRRFGKGDLGHRGMALFFLTHNCNYVCQAVGLKAFDVPAQEHGPETLCLGLAKKLHGALLDWQRRGDTKEGTSTELPTRISHEGLVHYELANLCLEPPQDFDLSGSRFKPSVEALGRAWYHMHQAALGLVPQALAALAKAYAGDNLEEEEENETTVYDFEATIISKPDIVNLLVKESLKTPQENSLKVDFMSKTDVTTLVSLLWQRAASEPCWFPPAMLRLVSAYHTGEDQTIAVDQDWSKALQLYDELFKLRARELAEADAEDAAADVSTDEHLSSTQFLNSPHANVNIASPDTVTVKAASDRVLKGLKKFEIDYAEVRKHMADISKDGGFGVQSDSSKAFEYYSEAATLAMKSGNMFFANQCMASAAALEGAGEEEQAEE